MSTAPEKDWHLHPVWTVKQLLWIHLSLAETHCKTIALALGWPFLCQTITRTCKGCWGQESVPMDTTQGVECPNPWKGTLPPSDHLYISYSRSAQSAQHGTVVRAARQHTVVDSPEDGSYPRIFNEKPPRFFILSKHYSIWEWLLFFQNDLSPWIIPLKTITVC